MQPSPATPALSQEAVNRLRWYQTIDLGGGIVTPGYSNSPKMLRKLHFPPRFDGKSVIDICAADGFFSFEAERRGAARVMAVDSFFWLPPWPDAKEPFQLARASLGSNVEDRTIDPMNLTPEAVDGPYDVAIFVGVLYHMKYPLEALERVASVTRDLLILETHADMLHIDRPAIAFYPGAELNGDPTNWCGPNVSALVGMLHVVGFRDVQVVEQPPFWYRAARAGKWAMDRARVRRRVSDELPAATHGGGSFWQTLQQGRVVVHARK